MFEFSLGIYIIVKGFKSKPTADENTDDIIQFGRDKKNKRKSNQF